MKLLYTSDLHGSEYHYRRLIALAERLKPAVIILGGDLLPDDSALDPSRMGHGQPEFVRGPFREFIAAMKKSSGCKAVAVIFGNHDWGSSAVAMEQLAADRLVHILDLRRSFSLEGLTLLGYSCTPPTPFYVKDFERLDL